MPRPTLRCFWLVYIAWCLPWLVRFRHKGLMDSSGIGYLCQSIRVTRTTAIREDQSLLSYKYKYSIKYLMGKYKHEKCQVWHVVWEWVKLRDCHTQSMTLGSSVHTQQTAIHCVLWHFSTRTSINFFSNLINSSSSVGSNLTNQPCSLYKKNAK